MPIKNVISRSVMLGIVSLLMLLGPKLVWADASSLAPDINLQRYGSGELRRFGFLVYEASLWAGPDPKAPPLALELTYKRDIAGQRIVDASVDQMRGLGASDQQLAEWALAMRRIFPDVKPGDQIVGVYRPGSATFYFNRREIGQIRDPDFARYFFGIWLDSKTSEPGLRSRLLRAGAG
jgi:hypothetical protein